MNRNWDTVLEPLAKVGYETMFEDKWDDLRYDSIERAMWKGIAAKMLSRLRELWKESEEAKP